jgi:hypothetical protein
MRLALVLAVSLSCLVFRDVGAAPPLGERLAPLSSELPGKPMGPIAVDYRLTGSPSVGVALTILVTARVADPSARLALEAAPGDARLLLSAAPELVAASGGVYSWSVVVVPLAAATYLDVVVAGEIDGVAQARSLVIPVRGAEGPATGGRAHAAPEALIELPVVETF